MSKGQRINQNMKINENVPVHGSSQKLTSTTYILNYLVTFLNLTRKRVIEFWCIVSQKPHFKKYVILLTTTLVLLILCYNLFGNEIEDENGSEKLKDIKVCFEDVTVVFENSENINSIKKCRAKNEPIKAKSKIRFVMGASQFFYCIIQGKTYCDEHFKNEIEFHVNNYGLKDLYFNYVIRDTPEFYLYEGRPLSCSFDENFSTENHESMIIIGIPQCNNFGRVKKFNKYKFDEFLKEFLNCFEKSGLLTDNYKIEFHESCKNYLFYKKILKSYENKILFTDDDQIMNVDYYFNISTSISPL